MPDFDDDNYEYDNDFSDAYDEEDTLDFEDDDIKELGSDPMDWGDGLEHDEEDGWFYDDNDKDERDELYDVDEDYSDDY